MKTRTQLQALLKPVDTHDELEVRLHAAVAECGELLDNLTATQQRCTELLEEKRRLHADLAEAQRQISDDTARTFVNVPRPRLRAMFIVATAIGGASFGGSAGGVWMAIVGALGGTAIGFAATNDRSP